MLFSLFCCQRYFREKSSVERGTMANRYGLSGAAAAQVVPHVHFHIIPRPALTSEMRNRSFTMFGRGQRSELDEEEAGKLAADLRAELARELEREGKAKI
jgi:diadenosine tetraphosphate (Ap4A) HIT family hydrolase